MKIKILKSGAGELFKSDKLFVAILILFAAQAIHVAVTSAYPLAFDEKYHFALVQHYSQHISPIIAHQPPELAVMGDATRLGSYLSHYLLSFILRIAQIFTTDTSTHVVVLRLINIGFVVTSLVLLRKFIVEVTGSKMPANGALALYAILPITSFLAAHINYDNLLFLCFASFLVVGYKLTRQITEKKEINSRLFLLYVSIIGAGTLVKFTFLPVAAVGFLGIVGLIVWSKAKLGISGPFKIGTVAALIVCLGVTGLAVERYGGNIMGYGTPVPDCSQVQSLETCLQYDPWARNYRYKQAAASDTSFESPSLARYIVGMWLPSMTAGLGFIGNGSVLAEPPRIVLYGLSILMLATAFFASCAIGMFRRNHIVMIFFLSALVYFVSLLMRNYGEYTQLHQLVAVQGRYALPFMIPLFAIGFMGMKLCIDQALRAPAKFSFFIGHIRTIDPQDAYEFSRSYWAYRVTQWRLTRN